MLARERSKWLKRAVYGALNVEKQPCLMKGNVIFNWEPMVNKADAILTSPNWREVSNVKNYLFQTNLFYLRWLTSILIHGLYLSAF